MHVCMNVCIYKSLDEFILGEFNVRVTEVEDNSITVKWNNATSEYCTGAVYYQVVLSAGGRVLQNKTTPHPSVIFNDLMMDTSYTVVVVPFNRAGYGMADDSDVTTIGNYIIFT